MMKGVSLLKKTTYILGFIILIVFSSIAIYRYQSSQSYLLEGSYQGEVLNKKENEVGIYTLNVEDGKVTLFSAVFNESYTGTLKSSESNEYDLTFEAFNIPGFILSDNEIQLFIDEEAYLFHKKSDVPIWEM